MLRDFLTERGIGRGGRDEREGDDDDHSRERRGQTNVERFERKRRRGEGRGACDSRESGDGASGVESDGLRDEPWGLVGC